MKKPRDPSHIVPAWLEGVWSGVVPATARHLGRSSSPHNPLPENGGPSPSLPDGELVDPVLLEEELALNRALRAASAPPASSNFTRRVSDAAITESPLPGSHGSIGWFGEFSGAVGARLRTFFRILPTARAVGFASVGLLMILAWFQWQGQQRTRLAQSVAAMAHSAQATGSTHLPAYLRDFDAIQGVGAAPRPDDVALLTALSQ